MSPTRGTVPLSLTDVPKWRLELLRPPISRRRRRGWSCVAGASPKPITAPRLTCIIALSCTVLHCLALSCTILHYLALSCTILHWCPVVPIRYTCSQQMGPVNAFDIAVVAHKVKVQYWGLVWSEKVGVGWWWISNRSGWLLELLTELKMAIILPTGQWYAPSAVYSVILCYTLLYSA